MTVICERFPRTKRRPFRSLYLQPFFIITVIIIITIKNGDHDGLCAELSSIPRQRHLSLSLYLSIYLSISFFLSFFLSFSSRRR